MTINPCPFTDVVIPPCYVLPNMKEVRLSFNFHYGSKERFHTLSKQIAKDPLRKVTYIKHVQASKGCFVIE